MKIPFFISLISICILISCADEPQTVETEETVATTPAPKETGRKKTYKVPLPPSARQELAKKSLLQSEVSGSYVGMFEAAVYDDKRDYTATNKINITLENVSNGTAKGYSVVAGNQRTFSGTYEVDKSGNYQIKVEEPGDDRYDGKFEFVYYPKVNQIAGKWMANNQKLAVSVRQFELDFRTFKYDPNLQLGHKEYTKLSSSQHDYENDGEFLTADAYKFNASTDVLKKEDIENMYKGDLEIMRNTIYARHGYSFKNRKMRFFFDTYVDWYMPASTDIRADLTALEKGNIDLLKRFEQHAGRYYDTFGR